MWSCDSVVILPKNSWRESLLEFLKISPAIPLKMSAGVLLKIPPGLGPSGIAGGILTKIPDGIPARVSFLIPRKKNPGRIIGGTSRQSRQEFRQVLVEEFFEKSFLYAFRNSYSNFFKN